MIAESDHPERSEPPFVAAEGEFIAAQVTTAKRGRFLPNLIANGALFCFNVLVGIWYTPYLLHHLGTAAYGIVPLVTQITGYMIVITGTLNWAAGRYITIAMEQKNDEEANEFFNTTLFGSGLLVLLLIPPVVWATINLGSLIVIPEGQELQSQWLFACTVVAFFLGTLQSPFGVSCFCLNRFDLQNTIALIQAVVRVGLVVLFFSLVIPQIWQVGVANLVAMFFGWSWSIQLWRKLTPQLTISIAHFRRKACKQLFSTSGWMALNQLGAILYWSIDLLIVNNMFGPDAGGRYAAVLQWSVLLRTMAGMVVSLFVPTMLYCYARHDIDGLVIYTRRAIKFMGLLMALPIGMICGFSVPILRTWLGPSFVDLSWLMSLMTISLSLTVAVFPLFGIENATNRVRMPAIVTLLLGIVNLGLAIFLAGPMGWGLYGVAAATAIALTVKNITFTPLYSAHILGCRISAFLLETVPILLATLATAGVGLLMSHVWDLSGWLRLIPAVAVLSAVYLAVVYSMLLNSEERQMAWKMVRSFVPSKGT